MIYEVKKWKIFQIKQMNEKYLKNFRLLKKFDKYKEYYRFYDLSINADIVTEFANLDYEIYKMEEKIEERKRHEKERDEREEEERRKRIDEKRKIQQNVIINAIIAIKN